jgi:hypothetical protein
MAERWDNFLKAESWDNFLICIPVGRYLKIGIETRARLAKQ